ncbi:MAG: hypothetical protein HXX19_03480 [Rhodoferax sp.]|nr:hypothetical protein [Rhodoferax sp.]
MACKWIFVVLVLVLSASGCSPQTAYLSAQEMQRAQCDKLTDLQELQRCRANARQPYDEYQRQREEVKPAQ